jgi:hypothetical protein
MAARDRYHDAVRNALIQDGWIITHDPYRIAIGRPRGYIDLGAEMAIAAEKAGRRIAVEVKSFLGASELDDLEHALGQYGIYRVVLEKREPERALYLALPDDVRDLLLEEADFRDILRNWSGPAGPSPSIGGGGRGRHKTFPHTSLSLRPSRAILETAPEYSPNDPENDPQIRTRRQRVRARQTAGLRLTTDPAPGPVGPRPSLTPARPHGRGARGPTRGRRRRGPWHDRLTR